MFAGQMQHTRDMKSLGAFTRCVALGLLLFFCCWSAGAQIFATNNSGLRGLYFSGGVAGDFDNDGVMDLLIEGSDDSYWYTTVWRNVGSGVFVDYSDLLTCSTGVAYGSVAVGDFYNDGRLDAIVTGMGSSADCNNPAPVSLLWHNLGNGSFSLITNSGLPGIQNGYVAVGDLDNDGKLDIALSGNGHPNGTDQVFRNQGNGVFTAFQSGISGQGNTSATKVFLADFDNDGYADVLLGQVLWRNLGGGVFTNINSGLPSAATAIGDFDNDGYLDVLVGGALWRNLGNGTFTNIGVAFPAVGYAVGDYDNDGSLDVLALQGGDAGHVTTQVWRNLGNGNFTNVQTVAGGGLGSVVWADFNGDSRLDFMVTGQQGRVNGSFVPILVAQVGLNISGAPSNTPPTAPPNLSAHILGHGGVKLSWGAATDDHTPSTGLNYNIRVGSASGGVDIVSPEADPVTGQRRVVAIGNAQERLFSLLTNLSGGTYYWSVQAIDTAFAGGAFATEATFVIPPSISTFAFQTNGQFQTSFSALAGSSYTLQASTNLLTWTNVTTLVPTNTGAAQLVDTNTGTFTRKYYRVRMP
jgi:hypothetical protein